MKKNRQRLLSASLTLCLLANAAPITFAASTTDIEGHWAQASMQAFIDNGWLRGYGDGNYGPNDPMTRAQYAALINRAAGLTEESDAISRYTDVDPDAWYYSDLAKAVAAGYMTGTSETTLSPDAAITRQQAVTMMARLLGLTATEEEVSALSRFRDASSLHDYAKNAAAALAAAGYLSGTEDGRLMPQAVLTRAQGITVLHSAREALRALQTTGTGSLKDGVYTGTGAGYGGTLKLQTTISGGKIAAVELLSNSETGAYLNRAKAVIDQVIAKQGTEQVDAVSGATLSSNGILTAINACLSQAKGGADTSTTGSTGIGDGGAGNAMPTQGEVFARLKDGDYEGSAAGYSGTTKVKVTVAGGKITHVEVLSHGDTTSYFARASAVIDGVVGSQSTDVDTVSGATYSSYGILNAINRALEGAESDTSVTFQVSNWAEFTRALAAAQDGDTIQLTADITDAGEAYLGEAADAVSSATLGMATISKAITIDGHKEGGAAGDCYTISAGENRAFCFYISGSGVVLRDLTIDGASYGKKMGGGIYLAGARGSAATPSLTLERVTVQNCAAYKTGMPGNGGGAIYAKGNVTLTATDCTFADNRVVNEGFGGAIYAQNATVVLDGCNFTGNFAPYGGAVAAAGTAELTVTNSTFSGNRATNGGKDLYLFDGKTPGKSGVYFNSAVSFALRGNTYQDDSAAQDCSDYSVVLGRFYEDGYAGSGTNSVMLDGHDVTFSSVERTTVQREQDASYVTLWMNIPYADFYQADVNNAVQVDAFTSATKSKTRTGSLAGGSYHVNSDGSDITGVTFPVVMTNADFAALQAEGHPVVTEASSVTITTTNRGQTASTTYTGRDALFESDSYSYYVPAEGEAVPTFYKVASYVDGALTFGAVQGVSTTLNGVTASFQTESSYGDYQLNLIGVDAFDNGTDQIFGVILQTKEGHGYGLRHVENIWRGTELAWCTGFTTQVHSCPTSSAHYAAIMGETITGLTYYTSKGIFEIPVDGIYVPVKVANTFSVADADRTGQTAPLTLAGFPEDYAQVFAVQNASGADVTDTYGFVVSDGALLWETAPKPGRYTLVCSDETGKYARYTASFTLTAAENPVAYSGDALALTGAEDALSDYVAAITSVSVDGKSYAATGRGAVTIIRADGALDLNAKSGQDPVFADLDAGREYTVSVTAAGYSTPLTFSVKVPEALAQS